MDRLACEACHIKQLSDDKIVLRDWIHPTWNEDEFMRYFGMDKWNTEFPLNVDGELNAEPRWMRQMGSLLLNHGIERKGYECQDCHAENGIMDFEKLGYTSARVEALQNLPELKTRVK